MCDDIDSFVTQRKNNCWLFGPKVHEIIYVGTNPAPMSPYFPMGLAGMVVGQSHLSESSLDQPSCCYSLGCYFVSKAETLVNWTLFGKRLANIASERRKVFGKLLFAIAVSLVQISSKDLNQVQEILKKVYFQLYGQTGPFSVHSSTEIFFS